MSSEHADRALGRPDMNAGRVYTHTVRRGEADTPLLTLLTTNYLHSSALEWVEHISNNRVLVDGLPGTSEQRPHEGATIHYHRPPWIEPPAPIAELKVLHDDGALVVLHKPSGLPVLPSELYYEHSVLRRLHHSRPSDAVAPHPAHRLGVGTSGLLLCAVGGPARAALSQAFERRKVKKTYRALVVGHVARARGQVTDEADNKRRKIEVMVVEKAMTRWHLHLHRRSTSRSIVQLGRCRTPHGRARCMARCQMVATAQRTRTAVYASSSIGILAARRMAMMMKMRLQRERQDQVMSRLVRSLRSRYRRAERIRSEFTWRTRATLSSATRFTSREAHRARVRVVARRAMARRRRAARRCHAMVATCCTRGGPCCRIRSRVRW